MKENLFKNYDPHCPSHVFSNRSLLVLPHYLHAFGYKYGDVQARDEM